jgi:hypothetical protein
MLESTFRRKRIIFMVARGDVAGVGIGRPQRGET